jgi:tRNA G18 (ribose-2'-O)-methylase SpoU
MPFRAFSWAEEGGRTERVALPVPVDLPPEAVRELLAPIRHDFTVAIHAAGNAFAVGAVVRVAHNFLAREVLLVGDAPFYEKASMGMEKFERVERVHDDAALLERIKGRPLWALEKEAATRSLYAVREFPKDVVFLLGSERFGVPSSLLSAADEVIGIPLFGVNHSLPLAVAAGIVMNEWARLRYAGGRVA